MQDFFQSQLKKNSKYRQAFEVYDRKMDVSLMAHVIARAEIEAVKRVRGLQEKSNFNIEEH